MGSSDLPQRTMRQWGGRGICTEAGMCGPHTGVTPGHDTECRQDHICELEVQPCWGWDTQASMDTRAIQLPARAAQPGLGVGPRRRCCGAHNTAPGLVWATGASLPQPPLFTHHPRPVPEVPAPQSRGCPFPGTGTEAVGLTPALP